MFQWYRTCLPKVLDLIRKHITGEYRFSVTICADWINYVVYMFGICSELSFNYAFLNEGRWVAFSNNLWSFYVYSFIFHRCVRESSLAMLCHEYMNKWSGILILLYWEMRMVCISNLMLGFLLDLYKTLLNLNLFAIGCICCCNIEKQ